MFFCLRKSIKIINNLIKFLIIIFNNLIYDKTNSNFGLFYFSNFVYLANDLRILILFNFIVHRFHFHYYFQFFAFFTKQKSFF